VGLDSFIPGGAWLFPIVMVLVMGVLSCAVFAMTKRDSDAADSDDADR